MSKPPVETCLQLNFKTPGGTLINAYADGSDHLDSLLNTLAERVQRIKDVEALFIGGLAAPAAAPAAPAYSAPAPAAPPAAAPPVSHPQGGSAPETDRWGNLYWYDHPEAPALPDGSGKFVLAQKTKRDKTGTYKVWIDPMKGPRPHPQNRAEFDLGDAKWYRG